MDSLLTNLADELLVQDITEPSAVLAALSDNELHTAYDHVLEQFALELLIGAHENSDWSDGKLVIDANHGPIHLLQAAFYAVKLEVQRRGVGGVLLPPRIELYARAAIATEQMTSKQDLAEADLREAMAQAKL